jgi:transposase InsO family protein
VFEGDGLELWFQRHHIPEKTRALIKTIRSSGPSRRVGGGLSNVCGRYPSKKMGVTIQFESHRVELAGIYEMEHDPSVAEYFDQPPPIRLVYESPGGRQLRVLHTPDFFVIRDSEAGWEEWKTEEELHHLNARNPKRYLPKPKEQGGWDCPPGAAYAAALGLYYRVRSSAEIDWTFQRNIQFLDDYLRTDPSTIPISSRERACAHVSAVPGLHLDMLLQLTRESVSADEIFGMIAANILHVNLRAAPLAEPSRVEVYSSLEASAVATPLCAGRPQLFSIGALRCGHTLLWDSRFWKVVNVGNTSVGLLSEDRKLAELPMTALEVMLHERKIELAPDDLKNVSEVAILGRLSNASENDFRIANWRSEFITRYLCDGSLPAAADVPARTFYDWLAQYREAEMSYGSGYLGLLPKHNGKGNYVPRLPEPSRQQLQEVIEKDYEKNKQKTMYASWIKLRLSCEEKGIRAPSYKTFTVAVRHRDPYRQKLKRQGSRSAYPLEPFYFELDLKTPRHGDRPFEIGHIDHTELDVEVLCSRTGRVLGRPWMTLLTDAYSRRVLAVYLTFDRPSYRSCMMVLRVGVRRYGRLPQIVVVDGGADFESTYFETMLAHYQSMKKRRPPAKGRFGSVLERIFGVNNTQFLYNLQGNTQIMRNVRQVTKSVDPKGLAIWPLTELHNRLCEYMYEVYDTADHLALGQSPREAFLTRLAETGERRHRTIPYDEEFLIFTLPTTTKGTAKVVVGKGVKIHHVYYWCEAFRDPQIHGDQVPVRYDPFDAGIAYAFVHKQWNRCHSEHHAVLKGRSEREVMLATQELRRRYHNHSAAFAVTARHLAEFLQSVEAEEVLLTQRLSDLESAATRLGLTSGVGSESCGAIPQCSESSVQETDSEPKGGLVADEVYGVF